jgi:aspartyl-tRNA(Asn)/glutamyl-tRNA(Gln) amidotransferase subunit C
MALTRDQVEKIAFLARLSLQPSEVDGFTQQLGQIVDLVDKLGQLDTTGVEPMVHAIELENVMMEDSVKPSLDRSLALSNAPESDGECFLVPAVLSTAK